MMNGTTRGVARCCKRGHGSFHCHQNDQKSFILLCGGILQCVCNQKSSFVPYVIEGDCYHDRSVVLKSCCTWHFHCRLTQLLLGTWLPCEGLHFRCLCAQEPIFDAVCFCPAGPVHCFIHCIGIWYETAIQLWMCRDQLWLVMTVQSSSWCTLWKGEWVS